jgi:AraC family transcriptional regulator, activator of mtrCDE
MPFRLTHVAGRINVEAQRMVPPQPVDVLNALAPLLRVRPELRELCRFGAQWAADHPTEADRWAPFHFVTRGACVIDVNGRTDPVPLSAGDAVVLPHGSGHVVRGSTTPADARGPFGIRSQPIASVALMSNTDGDPETQLICGRLRFDLAADNLVLAALPDIIVVSAADDGSDAARLRMLMTPIQEELEAARPGAAAIACDLASALFVMVLRTHLERERNDGGLLALLAHRQAGRAVVAMLDDPARNWTLDELAACANASRASLVRMFRRIANQAPLAVLAELRLLLARRTLAAKGGPVAAIAGAVGYRSESAFSRAFHRRFGVRPGEARARVG